jgi:hypothetical protein
MVSMNRLTNEERVRVIIALLQGNAIRATVRMTGIAKNTVAKLLCDTAKACQVHYSRIVSNLAFCLCQHILLFVSSRPLLSWR